MSSEKIEAQREKNKERAKRISNLKGVPGDKPKKTPTIPSRSKTKSKNSAAAALKAVGNLFKDNTDTAFVDPGADFVDPGNLGAYDMPGQTYGGFKKGGRLKKTKVKKRAALRGQRCELRGS
tara:strand:- start:130 stop:495 length:366 start_codon:yes stop_codon:yes gene_type:complete